MRSGRAHNVKTNFVLHYEALVKLGVEGLESFRLVDA
jgi:hypothetical protein